MDKRSLIYECILDEISEGVHVVDEQGKSIIYNRKMAMIESMDQREVLNRSLLDVFRFPGNQNSTLLAALNEGKTYTNMKQTYFNEKGTEITTINHTFPVLEDGRIIGAIEIANDVTKMERLIRDNLEKGSTKYTFDSIIGESPALLEVIEMAKRASRTSSSVLIIGETGTGKELFAQSIHHASLRSTKPFISQNCAALPDNLIEGLMFGTSKGAFTGAIERPGLFEQAEGGTLFLDEINSLSLPLQAKLLRAIQEKNIRRVGDTKDRVMDVRIIAAINEDPIEAISKNHLRKDLFYRLGVVSLFIPALKERKEDILPLVNYFIQKYNQRFGMAITGISKEVERFFLQYDWPGNVRELQHIIEGAMNIMADGTELAFHHLPNQYLRKMPTQTTPVKAVEMTNYQNPIENMEVPVLDLKTQMEEFEKLYIQKVISLNNGNISRAAKQLGVSRQSLQYRLRKYKEEHI